MGVVAGPLVVIGLGVCLFTTQRARDTMRMIKPFFCRAVLSTVVGIALSFFIMFIWYVTQPVVMVSIEQTRNFAREMGHNNTFVEHGYTLLTWIEYWWGPLVLIGIGIVWLFVTAQREEWRGHEV